MSTLAQRLSDEADQCRQDGADDIARLLDEAAAELTSLESSALQLEQIADRLCNRAAAPQPAQEPRDWKAEFGAMQAHAADLSAQLLAMQRAQPAQHLLQDTDRKLFDALARDPNARQHVRDAAAAIADAHPAPEATGIVEDMAHRLCWRYKHSSDPAHSHTYTFNRSTLLAFADALLERQRQYAQAAEARAVGAA